MLAGIIVAEARIAASLFFAPEGTWFVEQCTMQENVEMSLKRFLPRPSDGCRHDIYNKRWRGFDI